MQDSSHGLFFPIIQQISRHLQQAAAFGPPVFAGISRETPVFPLTAGEKAGTIATNNGKGFDAEEYASLPHQRGEPTGCKVPWRKGAEGRCRAGRVKSSARPGRRRYGVKLRAFCARIKVVPRS